MSPAVAAASASRRVLPSPARPSRTITAPRPPSAPLSRSRITESSDSRPRSGDRITPGRPAPRRMAPRRMAGRPGSLRTAELPAGQPCAFSRQPLLRSFEDIMFAVFLDFAYLAHSKIARPCDVARVARAARVIASSYPARGEENMSTPTKPSIVFAHGIWADGSCFNKLIPPLQAEGYEVISAQYGRDSAHPEQGQQPGHPRRPLLRRSRHHRRGYR